MTQALWPLATRLLPRLRVFQDQPSAPAIGHSPFLDFVQGSKAAETREIFVEAAIPDAGGLDAVGVVHAKP